jgi:hypothetical protein
MATPTRPTGPYPPTVSTHKIEERRSLLNISILTIMTIRMGIFEVKPIMRDHLGRWPPTEVERRAICLKNGYTFQKSQAGNNVVAGTRSNVTLHSRRSRGNVHVRPCATGGCQRGVTSVPLAAQGQSMALSDRRVERTIDLFDSGLRQSAFLLRSGQSPF